MLRAGLLIVTAVALGLLAKQASASDSALGLAFGDLVVGWLFLGAGALVWHLRPANRTGLLMIATGVCWFLADPVPAVLFLHRGPLVHLLVAYPSGRIASRFGRVVVGSAYIVAGIAPLAQLAVVSALFGMVLAAVGLATALRMTGTMRRAKAASNAAAAVIGAIILAGSAARLIGSPIDVPALIAYDVVLAVTAVALAADIVWGRWSAGLVGRFVVDLGDVSWAGTARDRLARAVGDPSLTIGYAVDGDDLFVDEAGKPVSLPTQSLGLVVTPMTVAGRQTGVIIHDPAVLDDPRLVERVAAATELARSNSALQAEIRARVAEVDASRVRLIHAADAQRRRIEAAIQSGAAKRLQRAGQLIEEAASRPVAGDEIAALSQELDAARNELVDFARGVHPAGLVDAGLAAMVSDLAQRSPVPVSTDVAVIRADPMIESTLYFVCSEALANAAKHASATAVHVELRDRDGTVTLVVHDDGAGGADVREGGGLSGLADRVEALGGHLIIDSPPGAGTRVTALMPRRAAAPVPEATQ